jgi:hypothetical protein
MLMPIMATIAQQGVVVMKHGTVRQIANLAYALEPDRHTLYRWMLKERLPQLQGRTPIESACAGEAQRVLQLLQGRRAGSSRLPRALDEAH